MNEKETGGQAFVGWIEEASGMSLRDWFAGMALMGIRADTKSRTVTSESVADWAYRDADAMLAERKK